MILAIIEHNQGTLNHQSLEILSLAKSIDRVEVAIVGENGRSICNGLGKYGVEVAHLLLHNELVDYAPAAWAKSIIQLAHSIKPDVILAIGSERGNEILAHIAAQLNLPMAANCTKIQIKENNCLVTRIRWGGSLLEEAVLKSATYLLTIAQHLYTVKGELEESAVKISEWNVDLEDQDFVGKVVDNLAPEEGKVILTDAHVVVGGGRGVGSKEGFHSLDELAELLGGAVGCSRVVTNHGWRPHADQVGQTGARVAPDLYIACGISGAIQHWVGCKSSKKIIVINTDAEAPIVSKADYAIIGDLHKIIPAINKALKQAND